MKNTAMVKKAIAIIALLIGLGFMIIPYDALLFYKEKGDAMPIFVVQKHRATHLHYDFRLEIKGALKSWAVPKGPSTDPHEKRLAIETEDHPMEYATFEGTIPEGHYGAGTVSTWDSGTFKNIKKENGKLIPITQCYEDGHIEIELNGTKLQGGYTLIRTAGDDKTKWLLIKMRNKDTDEKHATKHITSKKKQKL